MLHNSWDILLAQINQVRGPRVGSPSLGKEGSYLYLRSQNKSLTKMTKCHIPSRQPPAQVSEEQSPTWLYNSVCPGDVLPQGRSNAQKNKGQGLCSCPPPPPLQGHGCALGLGRMYHCLFPTSSPGLPAMTAVCSETPVTAQCCQTRTENSLQKP